MADPFVDYVALASSGTLTDVLCRCERIILDLKAYRVAIDCVVHELTEDDEVRRDIVEYIDKQIIRRLNDE